MYDKLAIDVGVIAMKKTYNKPALLFESFSLMDAVAATCMVAAQHESQSTCAWYNEDFEVCIFETAVVPACEFDYVAVEVPQDVVFPS